MAKTAKPVSDGVALAAKIAKGGRKGKKGSHKAGRNRAKCEQYRATRSIPNKRRKLRKHIAKHESDECAAVALRKVGNPSGE